MTDHVNGPDPRPTGRHGYKKGWRRITPNDWGMNITVRLRQLTESRVASDEVKNEAHRLLSSIVNEHISTENFIEARKLIKANYLFNKKVMKGVEAANGATSHAIFMACQACENLHDLAIRIPSGVERNKLMMQIATAINVLSEVQSKLLGGSDDSEG